MSVSWAELTAIVGSSASPAMPETSFDAETTQLAARARSGDREAFSALIDLHQRAARRVAAAALGNSAEADEAVQDACLIAWRRIDRLEDPGAFRAWLLRITWRKALDRRRSLSAWLRRLRQPTAAEDEAAATAIDLVEAATASPADELLASERDRIVAQLIQSLPPRLRDPFLLAASGEHRYEDIAVLLGLPLGTVKWRMAEARRVLREKLVRLGFGDRS
jgi:RNA polymerase sigma-70 factor (ECF subfamily)